MKLKTIFQKPVDRPIEGVIKADDDASLRLEIEEYVLTNEVEKRLEDFLGAYNHYEGANGVWVSGFFGSGKSHLLKMLALLLENRQVDGVSVLDSFSLKCGDNKFLRAELDRAVAVSSKSILFNIDQKADVISKSQTEALVAVFVKVFDEMCGYYGKQGYIAQFERDLDSRGLYKPFKSAFETIADKSWHEGRELSLFETNNIAKAYAQVADGDEVSASDILEKYRSQYRVSIEDFAEQVHAYIERQAPDFRLNFFVDEVGQYIADNIKLMTNLQTIAESLATKCQGRAWIIVTAQEDMRNVLGEMGKQQSNDFSKIQARFANRMKLTSADVAEVIQKRLLAKTDEGTQLLADIYKDQSNNFKTLFDFADGSQTYQNFRDQDHFVRSYPFISYQFALFQSAIQDLSHHNAFEGKHSSVGERSMLGVFQQVAILIGDYDVGQLATFDLMFEGIRTALTSGIQRAIIKAENHLNNPFAVKLLKALFLVKYVKEFKPTLRNLCVLMLEAFDQDLPALKKRIEEALNLLEQQTYVQRNSDYYEYLTDDEKDIEQDIKNTEVESTDVANELASIVFDYVIKQRKIRYDATGQDYPFSRKLDDQLHGRAQELAIHVISPFSEAIDNSNMLATKSMAAPTELLVVMPADERLVRDLTMYKRTEKYISQNMSTTQRDEVKRILVDKGFQNQQRQNDVKQRVSQLLGQASIWVAGTEIEVGGNDGQARIFKGFSDLIARTYTNLRMLRGIDYKEDDIKTILESSGDTLFGNDATSLSEAEQEMLSFIQSNDRKSVRTTVKSLMEKFERKPNGWYYAAILCILANLCARGKIDVRSDGNLLEGDALEKALRNSHGHGNVVLELQIEFTRSQVRALDHFFNDFFDNAPQNSEAKPLAGETAAAFQALKETLTVLAAQADRYPFLQALNPVMEHLNTLTGKPYAWYLQDLAAQEDTLFEHKENIIDPIRRFMNGSQKAIYDDARAFVEAQQHNVAYLEGDDAAQIVAILHDPTCFRGNHMQQVKNHVEALRQQVDAQLEAEITKAKETVSTLQSRIENMAEFSDLSSEQQAQLIRPFNELNATLTQQTLIAVIRDTVRQFEENTYQQQLSTLASWVQPTPNPEAVSGRETTTAETAVAEPPSYVSSRAVQVVFDKPWLADEADVERYLQAMREALLEEIRQGKRIQI